MIFQGVVKCYRLCLVDEWRRDEQLAAGGASRVRRELSRQLLLQPCRCAALRVQLVTQHVRRRAAHPHPLTQDKIFFDVTTWNDSDISSIVVP